MKIEKLKEITEEVYELPLVYGKGVIKSCFQPFTRICIENGIKFTEVNEFMGCKRTTSYKAHETHLKKDDFDYRQKFNELRKKVKEYAATSR